MIAFNAVVPELAVTDWHASLAFYVDILGFEVAYARPEEGFAFLQHGEAQLMIDQIGTGRSFVETGALTAGGLGRGVNLQIRVASVDPLLDGLRRASLPLQLEDEERVYTVDGLNLLQRQFVVADPDGYLLRFCQAPRVVAAAD